MLHILSRLVSLPLVFHVERCSLLFALLLCTCACDDESAKPAPAHRNVGVVLSTDWHDRSFILEEDGTHITFQLKSCAGTMPIWPHEHIEIHYFVRILRLPTFRPCETTPMKITIKPTAKLISVTTLEKHELPRLVRVWEGITDKGAKCTVLVSGVAVANSEDQSEFDRNLREFVPRERDREFFDLRQIL
jgi:hypothetical protein